MQTEKDPELVMLRKRVILQRRELKRLNKQVIVLSERAKQRVRRESYNHAVAIVDQYIFASSARRALQVLGRM